MALLKGSRHQLIQFIQAMMISPLMITLVNETLFRQRRDNAELLDRLPQIVDEQDLFKS